MNQLTALIAWLGTHWMKVCAAVVVVAAIAAGIAVFEAGRYKQVVHDNPPLPKKQARALIARSRADSVKAVVATHIARVYHKQADSALAVAHTLTAQADSTHAQVRSFPAAARGPISTVQRALAVYQSPFDTLRH